MLDKLKQELRHYLANERIDKLFLGFEKNIDEKSNLYDKFALLKNRMSRLRIQTLEGALQYEEKESINNVIRKNLLDLINLITNDDLIKREIDGSFFEKNKYEDSDVYLDLDDFVINSPFRWRGFFNQLDWTAYQMTIDVSFYKDGKIYGTSYWPILNETTCNLEGCVLFGKKKDLIFKKIGFKDRFMIDSNLTLLALNEFVKKDIDRKTIIEGVYYCYISNESNQLEGVWCNADSFIPYGKFTLNKVK